MKIATVVGARPQFIKAAVVSRALRAHACVDEFLIHTGQHYDANMSDVFFRELDIPEPDIDLNIGSGSHGAQTGLMLQRIEDVLLAERPDWVLVFGDTNSTLAGALAGVKLHVPVAHVEAGLRSFNRRMPEEINRVATDAISDLLFAPSDTAVSNLRREGVAEASICRTGDVMFDAALFYAAKANNESEILRVLGLAPKSYVLATIHRAENTDDTARLQVIMNALTQIANRVPVVLPLHPRTRGVASRTGVRVGDKVSVIDPVGYLDMTMLERNARVVVTDSGGVQKEAFFHRVPCVTLRDETEWVELVTSGWNRLAPPVSVDSVVQAISEAAISEPHDPGPLYGDGYAAKMIAEALISRGHKAMKSATAVQQ